jgi:Mg-chelatase subunit ChlD
MFKPHLVLLSVPLLVLAAFHPDASETPAAPEPSVHVAALRSYGANRTLLPCATVARMLQSGTAPGPELLPSALAARNGFIENPELKATIEAELARTRRFRVAKALDGADLVLFVEGTYVAFMTGTFTAPPPVAVGPPRDPLTNADRQAPARPGFFGYQLLDEEPNHLMQLTAFAVPRGAFPVGQGTTSLAALLERARWQGVGSGLNGASPSPRAFVQRFAADMRGTPRAGVTRIVGDGDSKFSGHDDSQRLCEAPRPALAGELDLAQAAPMTLLSVNEAGSVARSNATGGEVGAAYRSSVLAVLVPVTVTDDRGTHVRNLTASAFHLFEDNVEQRIGGLVPDRDPINVAFVIDASRSMASHVEALKAAVSAFIDSLGAGDAVMVVSFNDRVYLASDLVRDKERARAALAALRAGGMTSRLHDAVVATAERLDRVPGRKAIVLLTDGLDVGSGGANAVGARTTIERSNVPV